MLRPSSVKTRRDGTLTFDPGRTDTLMRGPLLSWGIDSCAPSIGKCKRSYTATGCSLRSFSTSAAVACRVVDLAMSPPSRPPGRPIGPDVIVRRQAPTPQAEVPNGPGAARPEGVVRG